MNQAHPKPLPKSDRMNWRTVIYMILLVSLPIVKALPGNYRDIGKNVSYVCTLSFCIKLMAVASHTWLFGVLLCLCQLYTGVFYGLKV